MMFKLTDTQTIILSLAATRTSNLAMPLPNGLRGAVAKMAIRKMVERGWLEEVDADTRKGESLWRETGDDHGATLITTKVESTKWIPLSSNIIQPVQGRCRATY